MEDLLGDERPTPQQQHAQPTKGSYVNLVDFNVSPQCAPSVVNHFDTPIASHVLAPPHTTQITSTNAPKSIGIKCKCTNAFSPMIKATNKNNKQIVETMDRINLTQLQIEKCYTIVQMD
jgi:hypothetical protein